jgi:hypothetical protein
MQQDLATKIISPSTDDRVGDAVICRLRKQLPEAVFRECVERLAQGKKVMAVARWLMKQDRGGLKDVGVPTLRKYLGELKKRVQAIKQKLPVIEQSLAQHLEIHERRVENDAAICGVAPPNKQQRVRAFEETIAGVVQWMSPQRVFALAFVVATDEIALVNSLEKQIGIPMTDPIVKLVRELRSIGKSLMELNRQTATADGSLSPAPPLSPLRQAVDDLKPAPYNELIGFTKLTDEYVRLQQQLQAYEANAAVPAAGMDIPDAGTVKPEGTPDG